MPNPTDVNPEITDAVTQANTKVVGEAPAESIGEGAVVAVEQAVENTVHNSQINEGTLAEQAATTNGITTLYEVDEAAEGAASKDIYE